MSLCVSPAGGSDTEESQHSPRSEARTRPAARLALLACALLLASFGARVQNVQFTQGAVGSGLDSSLQIPVAAYPGRGAPNHPARSG